MKDLAWASVTPRRHVHHWVAYVEHDIGSHDPLGPCGPTCVTEFEHCGCGLTRADFEARQKRGRSSLRAGKDAERAIAKSYGGTRTGQFGGPDDVVVGELFIVQSKAGRGWFREAVWAELAKLTGSQRIPTLVISDRPGPGHKTRRYVIRTLEDDVALHGTKP
jgi:hypothetical protein